MSEGDALSYRAAITDWLALLGLDSPVHDVFAGETTVDPALAALETARSRWPEVGQDYVAVVDAVTREVLELRPVIARQNAALRKLADELAELRAQLPAFIPPPAPVPTPVDRLLTAAEQAQLKRLPQELADIKDAMEAWAEELAARAQALQDLAEEADEGEDDEDDDEDDDGDGD